jgi:hypothetical protein
MTVKIERPRVRVGYEFLRNLGNFQNVKVKIEIEDSVREGETTPDACVRINKLAEERLLQQILDIEEQLDGEGN